jgi:hypothetical protein
VHIVSIGSGGDHLGDIGDDDLFFELLDASPSRLPQPPRSLTGPSPPPASTLAAATSCPERPALRFRAEITARIGADVVPTRGG